MDNPPSTNKTPPEQIRRRPRRFPLFCCWLIIIVATKWHSLTDPPTWDAAFGLFPAAGELADTGFDLPRLLKQPTYHEGGPNCHAESVVTWITAGVLRAFGKGQTAFIILHFLQFATAAWTLAVLFRFANETFGLLQACLICAAVLACPLFSAQVSAMYFEIPLAACAVSSLVAYAEGRIGQAIVWSILAVLVKQPGIVVPGTLIAAILLRNEAIWKRLGLVAAISVPAFVIAAAPLLGTRLLESYSTPPVFQSWWNFMSLQHWPYLKSIPDVLVAYLLYIICGLTLGGRVWAALRRTAESPSLQAGADAEAVQTHRAALLFSVGVLQMIAFAGFFFIVSYVGHLDVYCLPRYFVFLMPMLVFGLSHLLATASRSLVPIALALATIWFVVNRDGTWYPAMQPNNGAIAERAECYRILAENQRLIVNAAARLPVESLLLYGLPEHYFLSHPWMGYATRRHPGGRCVMFPAERPASLKIADLPDRFYIILDSIVLGGRDLRSILREAGDDATRQVRLVDQSGRSPFSVKLFEVSRVPAVQTSSRN